MHEGPTKWVKNYPDAGGKRQSPIDIITRIAKYDENLKKSPLIVNYDLNCCDELMNMGHTFQIVCNGANNS